MKLLIVEDEPLLARQLVSIVQDLEPTAEIVGQCTGIVSTLEWLRLHDAPDLILMDIELSDGQCFEIFRQYRVVSPVIFTTAYDEYALKAFKVNSVDYLLKPVRPDELAMAFHKWKEMKTAGMVPVSMQAMQSMLREMMELQQKALYKERILVRQGQKMISVNIPDVAYFNAKNTLNFITTKSKQQYFLDHTLDQVEQFVCPKTFFRANRQFIVSHDIITALHPWFNGRIKLETSLPTEEAIIISRDKAPLFKAWMGAS